MKEPSEEVKEVERRYEETIDKIQQLVDRMKTERMSQAEFEQYAKEHGYIISTTNIIEQIRAEIKHLLNRPSLTHVVGYDKGFIDGIDKVLQIIDNYRESEESEE